MWSVLGIDDFKRDPILRSQKITKTEMRAAAGGIETSLGAAMQDGGGRFRQKFSMLLCIALWSYSEIFVEIHQLCTKLLRLELVTIIMGHPVHRTHKPVWNIYVHHSCT